MVNENPLRQLTDHQLRGEVARRRLLYIALSVVVTLLVVVAISAIGRSGIGLAGAIGMLVLVMANLAAVFVLFRWMSHPSKERARRRRLSVLKMLGVEEQLGSPEDETSTSGQG